MRKRTSNPSESPKFFRKIAFIASVGLGLPLTIALLPRALGYGDAELQWGRIAVAALPIVFCAVTGGAILWLIFRLAPLVEEELGTE